MDCHPNSDIVGAEFLFSNILPAMFSLAIVPINAFAQSRFLDDARRGLAFSQLLSGTALFISVYTLDSNGNWNAVIVSACAALALSSSLAVRTADRRYMTPLHSLVGGLLFVFLIFLDVFIINRGSPAIRDSIDIQMPPAMIVVIFIHTATFWCALLTQKWTFWIPSTLFPLAYAALLLYIKYGQTECPMNTGNGSQWSYGQTLSILTIAYPLFKKLEEPSSQYQLHIRFACRIPQLTSEYKDPIVIATPRTMSTSRTSRKGW